MLRLRGCGTARAGEHVRRLGLQVRRGRHTNARVRHQGGVDAAPSAAVPLVPREMVLLRPSPPPSPTTSPFGPTERRQLVALDGVAAVVARSVRSVGDTVLVDVGAHVAPLLHQLVIVVRHLLYGPFEIGTNVVRLADAATVADHVEGPRNVLHKTESRRWLSPCRTRTAAWCVFAGR